MEFRTYNTGLGVFAGRRERKAMEQFLNLFWLAIVLVTTLTWRTVSARQQQGNHYRPLQHAAALGSAFLVLFFPLSMTDDLHPEIMLVEAGDQRHLIVLACPDQHSPGGTAVWATCVASNTIRIGQFLAFNCLTTRRHRAPKWCAQSTLVARFFRV